MSDTADRVSGLERLVLQLGETIQRQQDQLREIRAELEDARTYAEVALKKLGM